MLELKSKLSSGQLADHTREVRALKPENWDGDVFALPEMELCHILIIAARKAGFYEDGQAPTNEQIQALSFDEAAEQAEATIALFNKWNRRSVISEDEKKSS